jgi:hypothetical protein
MSFFLLKTLLLLIPKYVFFEFNFKELNFVYLPTLPLTTAAAMILL